MTPCVDHGQPGNAGGYAYKWIAGRKFGLHRVALARKLRVPVASPIFSGKVVRHSCDNPRCINPEHLELGTHKDNTADMYARGRAGDTALPGARNGNAKLTDEVVRAIRASSARQVDLAAQYGVTQGLISRVKRRAGWAHL